MNRHYKTLELDKILERLAGMTSIEDAREMALNLEPVFELKKVEQLLQQTDDAVALSGRFGAPSFGGAGNCSGHLRRAQAGGCLTTGELLSVASTLRTIRTVKEWHSRSGGGASSLDSYFSGLVSNKFLEDKITSAIISEEEISDKASPVLSDIRRKIRTASSKAREVLDKIIHSSTYIKYLQDTIVTQRDGRYVVPVRSECRGNVPGLVHDTSSSGATVFIEPMGVVQANNDIKLLQSKEEQEIERILFELSANAGDFADSIIHSYKNLAQLNLIFAKADLAYSMKASKPIMNDRGMIELKQARHPLIDKNKVVPVDVMLGKEFDTLVITGPNTGGKTVTLKTIGLLTLMAMCGLLVPCADNSELSVFRRVLVDIGDEQSIEDDLSTYSSHLTNMKNMMKYCNEKSLILIDEFGGGTEPQIGGAIAEAVLKRFNAKKTFGVITTHYQNLKHFAEDHEGVVNGAMLYDRHEMRALFQLQIGNPGSSFAVEIARKIGLPEEVIADASEIVGSEYIQSDKYLQDIVRDKRYWETKRQNIRKREKVMEDTIARYERELEELEKSRKEILKKAKEDAEHLLEESNAKIENTIRTIKEAQAEKERTRMARQELTDFRQQVEAADKAALEEKIARKMEKLREKQERKKDKKNKQANQPAAQPVPKVVPIQAGDYVRIKGQTSVGQVMELNGKNAVVMFGLMKTNVKAERLERAEAPKQSLNTAKATFVSSETQERMYEKKLNFKQDIDVRGMRGDEAIQAVTYFIDDAILVGVSRVRILHGTGTGILRTLIRQYLATVPGVKHFQDEHVQFGGAGITVVDLK